MIKRRAPSQRKQAYKDKDTPYAREALPRYELDDGPLTTKQMDAIDRLQPPSRGRMIKSLF